MDRSEATQTLLNAVLQNQSALAAALKDIAAWAAASGADHVADEVREHLEVLEYNQNRMGVCIAALMR